MKLLLIFLVAVPFVKKCSSEGTYIIVNNGKKYSTEYYKKVGNGCLEIEEKVCGCGEIKRKVLCGKSDIYLNKK